MYPNSFIVIHRRPNLWVGAASYAIQAPDHNGVDRLFSTHRETILERLAELLGRPIHE